MAQTDRLKRIGNLDALRIGAALFIVFYHSGWRLFGLAPFGAFCVLVFFNVSGFAMAMTVVEAPQQFLRRRLLRIVPAYWALTLAVFALSEASPHLFHSTRPNPIWLLKSLFFIPFAKAPDNLEPLVFVGWTLNCEVFFYLLLAAGLRLSRRPLLCAAALILLVMMLSSIFAHSSDLAFFYSRSSLLAFPLGMALYPIWRRMSRQFADRWMMQAYALLVVELIALCWLEETEIAPYRIADSMYAIRPLLPQVLSILLMLALLVLTRAGHDLRSSFLVLLAESTYVLYLMHAYILLAFMAVERHLPGALHVRRPLGFACVVLTCTGFALAAHLFIERPCVARLKKRYCSRLSATVATSTPRRLSDPPSLADETLVARS